MAAATPEFVSWSWFNPSKISKRSRRDNLILCSNLATGLVFEEKIHMIQCVKPQSNPSSPKLKQKLNLSEIKLHFLEERNEEILSERLLNLSRCNKIRSALELYMSIDASGLRPNAHACNSLLSCLVRNGLLDDALRVFEIVRREEIATCHAYTLVLKAIANARGCNSALELFSRLEGEEKSKKNFDIIVYNTMISIAGKAKNWVEVERLWRKLERNGLSGSMITYCLLVSTFVQCGQMELALGAYCEMIRKGLEPNEDVMKAIVASCTKEGNWEMALSVFEKMLDRGFKPNIIVYNAMINCLAKAGEDVLAFRIYSLMKSLGHTPDVYTWSSLLSALYRSKHYANALQFFEGIRKEQDSQLNAHLYNTALMSCRRLGLWERSLQLLWQMETSGIQMSTASYNHVICTCEVARKPKVALHVYQHMIHQKCGPDTFTYLSLIRACIWGSLWMEVEKILESVALDASLYNALIHGFCLRGKITLAKKLYTKMRSIGLKADGKTRALMLQHLTNNLAQKHPRARGVRRG